MMELEKILEEVNRLIEKHKNNAYELVAKEPLTQCYTETDIEQTKVHELAVVRDIIRKHMNDGWIPVEKEWPPFGQRLQATILHHEWVTDYDSAWVPEEEKIHHPEYTEVCEIYPIGEKWCYNCIEDDYNIDIAYIEPAKVLSRPVAEIIAWRPLPEPYRPERNSEE